MKVLLIDDQAAARSHLMMYLDKVEGFEVVQATSLSQARSALSRHTFDAAFIDLCLDETDRMNRDGLTLIQEIRERTATVPIVVSALHELGEFRSAMAAGAHTYLAKDELSDKTVLPILEELQGRGAMEREVMDLHGLIGTSPPMQKLRQLLRKVAASDAPVLILGPTGSGKELAARAIHAFSRRRDQPLLAINCAAIAESLVEAELFGHEKGSFTGADKRREGVLSEVKRGTLFLDEIAELRMELQTKLLRVLENSIFRAVGATRDSEFHGRILAATHVDLPQRVKEGGFREDLYYRLEVLSVHVPSLDQRKEDIPLLVRHLAQKAPQRKVYTPAALDALCALDWPGNVRQLRNVVNRLAVLVDGESITAEDILHHRAESDKRQHEESAGSPSTERNPDEPDLMRDISVWKKRDDNALLLARNQAQALAEMGKSREEICSLMGISRATYFRIRGDQED